MLVDLLCTAALLTLYMHESFVTYRWFHGTITRDQAEALLSPHQEGLFLVRDNLQGDYTISVW